MGGAPPANPFWSGTDDLWRPLVLPAPARRVVSLVPSVTELLAHLGAEVAGYTTFCVRPPGLRDRARRVGGTKRVHADRVDALAPDLVWANEEENERAQVRDLAERHPVYVTRVADLEDNRRLVQRAGELLDAGARAAELVAETDAALDAFRRTRPADPLPVAYAIWREPWMFAGGGTFIDAMLNACGLRNVLADRPRYPALPAAALRTLAPAAVLLSSEPYPFAERHLDEARALWPGTRVVLADGEAFSWYGLRPRFAPEAFAALWRALEAA
jgi:ABC-type Fe3+-hydroxamate transport system substrate-binding protein